MRPRSACSFLLAIAALLLGCFAAGQQTATKNTSAAVEAHLGKGYDNLKQDRYDAAVAEFRAALDIDPTLVLRARFPMAVALFEMHKFDESRREFEIVRHETGEHPNVSYYMGRIDLEEHQYDRAVHDLTQAIANPPFPNTSYYLGFAYFKQGDLADAEKWLDQASHTMPHDARVPYQLGLVYRKRGAEDKAKQAFATSDQLRQKDSEESRLKVECGRKLDEGGRGEAHMICDQLYDADDADKLTALGTLYGQHGDAQAALKPFLRAAELTPQSPQTQYNLALTYYQLGRFEDASTPLANAVKRWPDLLQLNSLYGAVLLKLEKNQQAYEVLSHAHQLTAEDRATSELLYTAALAVARGHQKEKNYAASIHYFEEASRLLPQEPAPHRGLAEVYRLIGQNAQAATEEQAASRLASNANSP